MILKRYRWTKKRQHYNGIYGEAFSSGRQGRYFLSKTRHPTCFLRRGMWLSLFYRDIYNGAYEESMAAATDSFSCLFGREDGFRGYGV